MATHSWILPWVPFVAFAVACLISALRLRTDPSRSDAQAVEVPSIASWCVFAGAIVIAVLALLEIGALIRLDYVPARGLLLGAVGGVLILLSRRFFGAGRTWPVDFSLAGWMVVVGRLWLTHGEVSGLASLIIGLILAFVCLRPLDRISESAPVVVAAGILALTVAVGFTRAEEIADSYWADLPLVIAGLYAIALGFAPRGDSPAFRIGLPLFTAAVAALLFWWIAQTLAPAAAFVLGLVAILVQWGLSITDAPSSSPIFGRCVAVALALAGATASFLLAAGYGIGLYALGGAVMIPIMREASAERRTPALPLASLAFSAAFIAYRLAVLGAGESVRSSGPGDIWDLIALGLGVVGIFLGASLLPTETQGVGGEVWSKIEYAFACIVPVTVLAYLWQPRAFAGLFVGSALAPLVFAALSQEDSDAPQIAITALLVGAVLLEIMPLLGDVAKPTRAIRIGLVLLLVILSVGRALLAGRLKAQTAKPLAEAKA